MPQTQHKCLELVLGADAAGAGARRALRARSAAGRCARAPAGVYINPTATTTTTSKRRAHRAVGAADGGGDAAEEAALALHAVHLAPRAQELPHLLLACARRRPHDKAVASDMQRSPPAGRLRPGRLARYAGTCAPACTGRAPPPRIRAGSRRARRARAGRAQASCASASTAPRYASSCRRRSSTNSPLWLCGKMRLAGRRRRYAGTPRSARCSASKLRKRRDTVHSASASATRTCTARAAPAGAFRTAAGAGAAPGRQAGRGAERALDGSLLDSPRAKGAGRRIRHATAGSAPCTRPHPCCPRCSARRPPPARVAALARLSAGGGRAAGCMHARSARRPVVQLRAARARAHCARAGAPCARASRLAARGGARLGQWPPRKAAPPPRVAVQGVQAAGQAATAARQRGRVARHRRQRAHSLAWAGDSRLCAAAVRLGARGPVERARAQRAARQRAGAGRRAAVVGAPRAAARRAPGRHLPTERGA